MAFIKKKTIKGKTYYYLEHSTRISGIVQKKEKYLGKELPKDIDKIKKEFISDIIDEIYRLEFQKLKLNFQKEIKTIPRISQKKELETFAIRFTYDTQRIEGSTLTLRETANLLQDGITPKEKSIKDVREAEAHRKVFYEMLDCKKDLSMNQIIIWHSNLFKSAKGEIAGKIRTHQVGISGSKFTPPSPVEIQPELDDFFRWYNLNKNIINPVKLSALVHLKFVTIHPFADGNGRISRLMMNFILNRNGFPMLNIHYEKRTGYYDSLEKSQIKKDETYFVKWFFKKYMQENKRYD